MSSRGLSKLHLLIYAYGKRIMMTFVNILPRLIVIIYIISVLHLATQCGRGFGDICLRLYNRHYSKRYGACDQLNKLLLHLSYFLVLFFVLFLLIFIERATGFKETIISELIFKNQGTL